MVSMSQMAVMGAIVATMLFWPLAVGIALVLALFGVPFGPILTFGGSLHTLIALFVWWLFAFVGASIYAACAFPWGDQVFTWPTKK